MKYRLLQHLIFGLLLISNIVGLVQSVGVGAAAESQIAQLDTCTFNPTSKETICKIEGKTAGTSFDCPDKWTKTSSNLCSFTGTKDTGIIINYSNNKIDLNKYNYQADITNAQKPNINAANKATLQNNCTELAKYTAGISFINEGSQNLYPSSCTKSNKNDKCPDGYVQNSGNFNRCDMNKQGYIVCSDLDKEIQKSNYCQVRKDNAADTAKWKGGCPVGYVKDPDADSAAIYICVRDTQSLDNYNTPKLNFQSNGECGEQRKITVGDILSFGSFVPVIPASCSLDDKGRPVAMSPALIPDILIRAFGFIASIVFYFFSAILVFSGIIWMWGSLNEKSTLNATQAKRNIEDTVWALIMVFAAYTIVMTIMSLLNFDTDKTDLNSFFTFGTLN